MISICEATRDDIPALYALYHRIGKKDDGYFEHAFDNGMAVLCAQIPDEDNLCGLCLLNWTPRYSLYRRLNIPEIQDLNVAEECRRRGVGTSLIKWCEGLARARGYSDIGIAVGLTKDYGAAQILYARMGYVPDGNGITYDREGIVKGQTLPVDDELSLMLVKPL